MISLALPPLVVRHHVNHPTLTQAVVRAPLPQPIDDILFNPCFSHHKFLSLYQE
jgi:hypothetical protein